MTKISSYGVTLLSSGSTPLPLFTRAEKSFRISVRVSGFISRGVYWTTWDVLRKSVLSILLRSLVSASRCCYTFSSEAATSLK